jgi:putative DNA primase/helicase
VSAELLLNIIREDVLTIGRKYKTPWHGQLRLKIMLISNEVPNLNDASGVLPSRFIKLRFVKSFFDREDPYLRSKLEAELPGIAGRCVRAYQRLCDRGKFVQPRSGLALEREVVAASDPWVAMLDDCFVVEASAVVTKAIAFGRFTQWCDENGRRDILMSTSPSKFSVRLRALVPGLSEYRQHGKPRQYVGIKLRKADPLEPP